MHSDMGGVDDFALNDIVGDGEQRTQELLVAGAALCCPSIAVTRGVGQAFGIEAALGAGRHDDGVLDALRLHQAQNLGAEIVAPVGPAEAAARHWPRAQMDALDLR